MTEHPPPGSPDARALGCQCPVYGNHNGKGQRGNGAKYGWYTSEHCDLHGALALKWALGGPRVKGGERA